MDLSHTEKTFLLESFRNNLRVDGRSTLDFRSVHVTTSTVPHAFGSATIVFGEERTKIIAAVKAEIAVPASSSQPDRGTLRFYLESSQTGHSLFTREQDQLKTKTQILALLSSFMGEAVDLRELCIAPGERAWTLHVDVLVLDELALWQLDAISFAIRAALLDLRLPKVTCIVDKNTGKVEVDLLENIDEEAEGADEEVHLDC